MRATLILATIPALIAFASPVVKLARSLDSIDTPDLVLKVPKSALQGRNIEDIIKVKAVHTSNTNADKSLVRRKDSTSDADLIGVWSPGCVYSTETAASKAVDAGKAGNLDEKGYDGAVVRDEDDSDTVSVVLWGGATDGCKTGSISPYADDVTKADPHAILGEQCVVAVLLLALSAEAFDMY
jgi:hypothetical protein